MKGIIMAAGNGTRLYPATLSISKQLLPVYDKPMIYYPLATLMQAGISDILIIVMPRDKIAFQSLLGDGSQYGIKITYAEQEIPAGIAEAFLIGEEFIGNDNVALILGDNIYHGNGLWDKLHTANCFPLGKSTVFAYHVDDPERYGVVGFDKKGNPNSIVEKPSKPKSNWAVTGLYFYTNDVVDIAKSIEPSARGELEITDINQIFLDYKQLRVEKLGYGYAWLDTGTHESLLEASSFVGTIERRQGMKIACLEEIAYNNGWMSQEQVLERAKMFSKTDYGAYLIKKANHDDYF